MEEIHSITLQKRGDEIRKYERHERDDFIFQEDIIGLDANVLIDIVESDDFKRDIKEQASIGVINIYTTNVSLGEARHVLNKYRNYTLEQATNSLNNILKEFSIKIIKHNQEGNELGENWVEIVKSRIKIKKFGTFYNDCKIIANLLKQAKINLYFTEDNDIERAIRILKVPIRVRLIGEASNLGRFEIKRFFRENHRAFRKKHERF